MRYFTTSFLFAAFALPCFGAEVIRVGKDSLNIAISHDATRQWAARDRVCILQRAREVVCGTVLKAAVKGAIVKLDAANYDILAGDKVIAKFQPSVPSPGPIPVTVKEAPLLNSVPESSEGDPHIYNVSAGVMVGTSYFYPAIQFQIAVAPKLSIGVGGLFLSSPGAQSLVVIGTFATISYYSQEYFRGLWLQGGAGVDFFLVSGTLNESAKSLMGLATVGWRGYWDLGLNIGVGAGLQYISTPTFTSITPNSTGFRPLVVVDIGFNF